MEKITMLGTGHAMTFKCYNTCFVYENENGKMLVDTGGGNQLLAQMQAAGINSQDIKAVFISHKHTDHLMGLFWLFRGPGTSGMEIYLHEDLMNVVLGVLKLLYPDSFDTFTKNNSFITVKHGDEAEVLGRKFRFLDLNSPNVTQYGFVMTMEDGEKFAFHGDVPFEEGNRAELTGMKYLMHEAFNLESDKGFGMPGAPGGPPPGPGGPGAAGLHPSGTALADKNDSPHFAAQNRADPGAALFPMGGMPPTGPDGKPRKMGHSTVKQAASYAQSLKAENLILVHGSDNDLENRKEKYIAEASLEFTGKIYAPNDLEIIELK